MRSPSSPRRSLRCVRGWCGEENPSGLAGARTTTAANPDPTGLTPILRRPHHPHLRNHYDQRCQITCLASSTRLAASPRSSTPSAIHCAALKTRRYLANGKRVHVSRTVACAAYGGAGPVGAVAARAATAQTARTSASRVTACASSNVRVGNNHWCRSVPPLPSGLLMS